MKKSNVFNFKKAMKVIVLSGLLMYIQIPAFGQAVMEYADTEVAQFISDLEAGSYDVYILSTSGGIYDISYPAVPKSTVIKGKEGLAERPVLKNTGNTSGSSAIIRINGSPVRDTVVFENLEFDGSGASTDPLIVRADNEVHLVVRNCYVHNIGNGNGAFRMNTGGTTFLMENTLLANGNRRIIHPYSTDALYGDITIRNCSFSGFSSGDLVYFRSAGGVYAAGNNVTIDHCTFNDISGRVTRYQTDSIHGVVSVTNSIFVNVASDIKADIIDYNYMLGIATGQTGTNDITTAPVFADAANLNFTLTNWDQLTGGDFQILGDLTWYDDTFPPRVYEQLERLDDTHVRVMFNELLDQGSATDPGNYLLSGTAGLTGNPAGATLEENGRYVTLEVGDMSGIQILETVVVTVSNVTDILGNVISANNVATYTLYDETPPLVTLEAQSVTNDPGQTVTARSNETGWIYLAHADVLQSTLEELVAAAVTAYGSSAEVTTADTDVSISTAGLKTGTYYAYAVDDYENISLKSTNTVTVSDVTAPVLTMEAQEVVNASIGNVVAQSNEEGSIYIILEGEAQSTLGELEAAVSANTAAVSAATAGTDVLISADGLVAGTYFGYAVDEAGNISAKSSNAITVNAFVPRVRYYDDTQAGELEDDLVNALDGDVFVLTSSGGRYQFSRYVNITAKVTIMADEDAALRPVLTILRENNTVQILRLYGDGASITVKGIEFDSESREPGSFPPKYAVRAQAGIGSYAFTAIDCYFRGHWIADNGSDGSIFRFYDGTFADSIILRNCIFDGDEGIIMNSNGAFGWEKFEITNCTFMNMPDDNAIQIIQGGEYKLDPISINHCTFYNTGGIDDDVIITDTLYNVQVTNSIFAGITANTLWHMWGTGADVSTADYINFFESPQPMTDMGGILGSNVWTEDPQFADAANGDLTLGNQTLYTLGNDGLPLGDLRWADIFGPEVMPGIIAMSDSTLLIKFDEWIDTTTAEIADNFQLSGSAGYTGAVKKAELFNFRSVLLTLESFINQVGNEIIITVDGVEDLKGNTVSAPSNAATYVVEEFRPVVTIDEQQVTNGTGQVVIAQSNQGAGSLYIVLEGEPQSTRDELDAAVTAMKGATSAVSNAFTDIEIDVYGIQPGTYAAYAVDETGNISDKGTNSIRITDGIPPVVMAAIQSAGNNADGKVIAQSNETGDLFIILDGEPQATLNDLVSSTYVNKGEKAGVPVPDTDVEIATEDLVPGIYYAYAVDEAGNMSAKGDSPINITDATNVGSLVAEDGIRIYSYAKTIVVETNGNPGTVRVTDLLGRRISETGLVANRIEITMENSGVYIVTLLNGKRLMQNTRIIIH